MTRWLEDKKRDMPKRINLTEVGWLVCEVCADAWVRLELFCQLADEMKLEPADASREVLIALAASLVKMSPPTQWEGNLAKVDSWMKRMQSFDDGLSDAVMDDRRWDVIIRIVRRRIYDRFSLGGLPR